MTIQQTVSAIKQLRVMLHQLATYLNSFQGYYNGQIIPLQLKIEEARYILRKLLAELGQPILTRQKYDSPADIEQDTDLSVSPLVLHLANQNEIDRLNYVRQRLWSIQRNLWGGIILPPAVGGIYPSGRDTAFILLEAVYTKLVEAETIIFLNLQSIKASNTVI